MLTHARVWYLIDAKSQRPGRLASQIGSILQGRSHLTNTHRPPTHNNNTLSTHNDFQVTIVPLPWTDAAALDRACAMHPCASA